MPATRRETPWSTRSSSTLAERRENRQSRQGRVIGYSSATVERRCCGLCDRTDRHRRRRRHHLGYSSQRGPQARSRPDVGARCGHDVRASASPSIVSAALALPASIWPPRPSCRARKIRSSRRTEMMSMEGRGRRAVHDGRRNLRLRARHRNPIKASAPMRLRRSGITRQDVDRLGLEPTEGRECHQAWPFRQESGSGSPRGRQPGARPRGISAAADPLEGLAV